METPCIRLMKTACSGRGLTVKRIQMTQEKNKGKVPASRKKILAVIKETTVISEMNKA